MSSPPSGRQPYPQRALVFRGNRFRLRTASTPRWRVSGVPEENRWRASADPRDRGDMVAFWFKTLKEAQDKASHCIATGWSDVQIIEDLPDMPTPRRSLFGLAR